MGASRFAPARRLVDGDDRPVGVNAIAKDVGIEIERRAKGADDEADGVAFTHECDSIWSAAAALQNHSGVMYAPVIPPSTRNVVPFTYDDSSLARNSAAFAISSGF